jgi:hypothetical protein
MIASRDERCGSSRGVIALAALQEYFWLEPDADDGRILTAFRNGHGRIRAIVEHKVRGREQMTRSCAPAL